MIKAVVVKYLGERKIVLANNSNIADFLTNVSKKFGDIYISGIMWNRCEVDSETFVAILNEQNLEVEVLPPANNNEFGSFVQSLKEFSPVKNVFSAVDLSHPVSFDFNNQQSSNPTKTPQLSTATILYQDSNYEDNVLEDLESTNLFIKNSSLLSTAEQASLSSAEPPTSQKINRIPFGGETKQALIDFFPPHIKLFLSNKSSVEDKVISKELMSCLLAFCCLHVPNHSNLQNRMLLRKVFFAKLKSTCISLYPSYINKWNLLFKKLPNNYRQRQFSKCHSLKVKRFPHFSVVNSSINNSRRTVNPILSESVVDKEQLIQDVVNEFKKKNPSLSTLSIIN
ncbi:uncharacterized protein LOC124810398 isoform X3 [Hydra vulgaris]|uniref:uncharacterized protein LOC124810398 isoform X3 n=1 Tax=Hydra vulgaris TaxID=6087 RepID=UPI0032EA467E